MSDTVRIGVGSTVFFDGEPHRIEGFIGSLAMVRTQRGVPKRVELSAIVNDKSFHVVDRGTTCREDDRTGEDTT